MDVFSFALQKRAVKLILVHNHPSGELSPSTADLEITERMFAIGKFLQVPVIDHLIITEKEYLSFADQGIIEKMEADNRFDLTFKNVDKLLDHVKEIEKSKKEDMIKQKEDLAKGMLKEGISIQQTARITGLTLTEIKRLVDTKK